MAYSATSSFSYSELYKKHNAFVNPAFEVSIKGKTLAPDKFHIPSMEINIPVTIGQKGRQPESGECSFQIVGMFDLSKSAFLYDLEDTVKVGHQIEVRGGYHNPKTLFIGVINTVDIQYGSSGVVVSVTALDAFSLMVNYKKAQTFNKEQPAKTVRDLLSPYTAGSPKKAKLGKIAQLDPVDVDITRVEMKDLEFLYFLARRFHKNLAIIHGEILFDDLLANTKPICTLTYGLSLLSFRKQLDTSRQYGQVEVTGLDPDKKPIKGVATDLSPAFKKQEGSDAAKLDPTIKDRVLHLSDKIARTEKDLKAIAQTMLDESALSFVSGKGTCIGLPELIPGRFIQVDGMAKKTNGTYFITRVVHSFGDNGYTTSFDIKGAKSR